MITIKLKLKSALPEEFYIFQKKWNNVYRYAYNRFIEGKSQSDIRLLVKKLNNCDMVDISWRQEAISQAFELYKTRGNGNF